MAWQLVQPRERRTESQKVERMDRKRATPRVLTTVERTEQMKERKKEMR
jgi:hypothetical protein